MCCACVNPPATATETRSRPRPPGWWDASPTNQPSEEEVVVQRPRPPGLKFKPFGLDLSAPWLPRPPKSPPRRLGLNAREQALAERIRRLKKEAGSHSPSAWTLAK